MPDTRTRAQRNRAVRQEALREQLAAGGHIQHVVDIAQKLSDVGTSIEPTDVQRLKAAADIKLKLIDKYLGSVKSVEVTGEDGAPIRVERIELVPLSADSAD